MVTTAQAMVTETTAGEVGGLIGQIVLPMGVFGIGLWLLILGNADARENREAPGRPGRGKRIAGLVLMVLGALLILGAFGAAITG